MKQYFQWLPNALTLSNLLMGCVAILYAVNGNLVDATYFIMIAVVFDFFDGFAARMLQAQSPIGKDLDSLADVVSFGVAPAFILYGLASHANYDNWLWGNPEWVGFACFLVAVASAYRLAKFNNDERQTSSFIGLPTPANALLIAGVAWSAGETEGMLTTQLSNPYYILGIVFLCVFLPVSSIHLMALKFKNFGFADNMFKYILVLFSSILLAIFQWAGFIFVIPLYIIISMIEPLVIKSK